MLQLALGKVDGDGGVIDDLRDRLVEAGHARAGVDVALRKAVGLDQLDLAVHKARVVAGEHAAVLHAVHLARQVEVLGVLGQQARVEVAVLPVGGKHDLAVVVGGGLVVLQHQLGKRVPQVGFEDLIPRAAAHQRGILLRAAEAPLLAGQQNVVDGADELVRLPEIAEIEIADVVALQNGEHLRPRAHVNRGPLAPRLLADIRQDLLTLRVAQADLHGLCHDLPRILRRGALGLQPSLPVAGEVLDAAPVQLPLDEGVDGLLVLGGHISVQ